MRIFIICLIISCSLNIMGQDNNGEMFLNADGSQNAYFIDTLHIDSLVIVRSKKNGHFFAIRNPSKKDLKGNIWNTPETYLYDYDPFDSWYLTNMPYDAVPNAIGVSNRKRGVLYEKYSRLNTKSYQIMGHSIVPKYYWLVLIRGDAYNFLTVRSVIDGGCEAIKFKNEKAYYKLLIPIWERAK